MKTIGLIGFSHDTSIVEYYQEIINAINSINNGLKYDILVSSIKNHPEENHLIARLCHVYFYMMSNGAQVLIFTNYKLETLSHCLNIPNKPSVLCTAKIIADKVKQSNIEKCLVFDLSLSEDLGFFLKGLIKEKVKFYVLNIQDREKVKDALDLESDICNLSFECVGLLNKIMRRITECGIQTILINSSDLNKITQQLIVDVPIYYVPNIHAINAIDFLTNKTISCF